MPAPITIGMKAALMPWRCGRPKEMLERPQVVLTLSSSRSRLQQREDLAAGVAERADRHDQRIDHDVMRPGCRNPRSARRSSWPPRSGRRGPSRCRSRRWRWRRRDVVFLDQRQDRFELLFLAGHGVDQRPALGDLQRRLDRRGHRAVDRQRQVDEVLHDLQRLHQQRRLGGVGVDGGDAGIDVEHGGAGRRPAPARP